MTTLKAVRIRSFGGPSAEAQTQLEQRHAQGEVVLQMG